MAASNKSKQEQKQRDAASAILYGKFKPYSLTDGVYLYPGQGNGVAIETQKGLVVIDAGPGGQVTQSMIANLRALSPNSPIRAIVYSHGHVGYNTGANDWVRHAVERGDPKPDLVGHKNVVSRYARYRKQVNLEGFLNHNQFQWSLEQSRKMVIGTDPTVTFTESIVFDDPVRPVHVFWDPSETDDCIFAFLPNQKILYAGPSVITGYPNIGTPLRTLRLTRRWVDTLNHMLSLNAEIMIPEFGTLVHGAHNVRERLSSAAESLTWLYEQTTDRMGKGMTDIEIIHDLPLPPHADKPYLKSNYGHPHYVIRDIFREHNGWWTSRNPTDLHPAHPDESAQAIFSAVDPKRAIERAKQLASQGKLQLALHVIDLIALAPTPDSSPIVTETSRLITEARLLKAEWCDLLAKQTEPFVSRSLYQSSAKLLRMGKTRWSQAQGGLHGQGKL